MELNTIAAAYGSSVASPEKPHVQAGDRKGFVESILEVLSEPLDFDMIHSKPINHPIFWIKVAVQGYDIASLSESPA